MLSPLNYWTIRLPQVNNREIGKAKEFFESQFPYLSQKTELLPEDNKQIQTLLLSMFREADDVKERALAGLCLRCYVSHRIFIACQTIPNIYNASAEKLFSYNDLLPLVLIDDGKALVIVDSQGNQHILHHDGTTQPIPKGGEFFSVVILQKFNPNLEQNESLNNWVKRLTCQNENIRSFLWQYGLATPTDEGLLCKNITRPISELFSAADLEIIKAFQAVYRRDRLKAFQKGRCSKPTESQLQEILALLQQQNTTSVKQLDFDLKRIAEILREDWLYRKTRSTKTVPLEINDDSTNNVFPNPELYHTDRDPEDVELEKLQETCNNSFEQTLHQTIPEGIQRRITELKESRGYKDFAQRYPEALRLIYQENISLGGVAEIWGIQWIKAQRILKLEDFLNIVQYRTEEVFLDKLLKLLNKYQSTQICNEPDKLKKIVESIREFALTKAFKEAKAELVASKTRVKNSLFAQKVRFLLSDLRNVAETKKCYQECSTVLTKQ
ncbi:hypothetical protein RIVM261_041410 [Rivularia sp. IAM M-261]|nr:hypothetical protein RIVM261_041410 [Rivularia sp. IAM M-261]